MASEAPDRRDCLAAILATAPLAASSPANASAFSFIQIDVPGATSTEASGINDAGQIVGSFGNSTGGHGFLDTGRSFTQLDVPGGRFTQALGINGAAQIAGTFADSTGPHGFLDTGGSFTQLDAPGAAGGTTQIMTIPGLAVCALERDRPTSPPRVWVRGAEFGL